MSISSVSGLVLIGILVIGSNFAEGFKPKETGNWRVLDIIAYNFSTLCVVLIVAVLFVCLGMLGLIVLAPIFDFYNINWFVSIGALSF